MSEVNKTLFVVQAVRAVARASVTRMADASYNENVPPPDNAAVLLKMKKAVESEMEMTVDNLTDGAVEAVCNDIMGRDGYAELVRLAINSYINGLKDYQITPKIFYSAMGELIVPAGLAQKKVVVLTGDDHRYLMPKRKRAYRAVTDEDDEIWAKFANWLNDYDGIVIPEFLQENHCAQTANLHTGLSFKRDNLLRFLRELSRTALPILDALLLDILIYGVATIGGDKLRMLASLKYTREIIEQDEYDWLRAWTDDRIGFVTDICNFLNCTTCPFTKKIQSKANLFLDDMQTILADAEAGSFLNCPACKTPSVQKVYVTTHNGLAFDLVKKSNQYGPLLRHVYNFIPQNFVINEARHSLHTIQIIEWYGSINEETDSHAFVVQVKGDELWEICDGDPLTWPNKVLNEADLRTRNMRVQVAFYIKESEEMVPE